MAESIAPRVPAEASRAAVARLVTTGAAVGLTACLAVGGLAFADGGYFPVSWGWSALPLLAVVAAALAIGVAVELSVLDGLFLGALAGLAGWTALSLLWTGSVPRTVLECERVLVYLGAAVAGVLLVRRSAVTSLVVALWAALVVVVTYGLLTGCSPSSSARSIRFPSTGCHPPSATGMRWGSWPSSARCSHWASPRGASRSWAAWPAERPCSSCWRSTSRTAGRAGSPSSSASRSHARSTGARCS